VFLASVDRASAKPGAPLTYFRGKFGRFQQSEDEAVIPQPMEDWIAAQRTIEIGVAMQRAGNIKAEEIAECERLLDLMDAAQDGPIEPWIETLDSYLDYFVSLSGSPSLQSAYRRRDVAAVPSAHATATHRRVLKAMQENDPQTAFKEIEDRTRGGI
jgi:DNA-binding GntR family transcriptional regulator